ncbi:hypothetical protein A2763_01405 [Candidatus Kaiserbacteria bacterium RIFCSPHIGHO2_01_FULL_54_36]|uniref:Uncharacterized protein n=1 Tax=Candidatus Kaiserbacteria bacterium RIFCSPHIGHO2_01_FULL_54_36 TaxID=1798482 RepID=A0A1F6CN52_9BACT|nr:MAG: hypothetical protein A2763_01405 [Candidatus Kaiserbacteria bacterium RIFCSPHIGHO2_01_FULL_54_36]OGG75774.1 MAG: hypothetical protein A3A41_00175 [Candidatus Kaiserbacteria bacterium RIFCSPLOWO2_01_FULL_54_22]
MKRKTLLLIVTAAAILGLVPVSYVAARHATNMTPDLATINTAENAYFAMHGKYFQVLINNQLPEDQTGVLADYVDPKAVPMNTAIDTYVGPQGSGYAVRWTIPATMREEGAINSVGYGPEALSRTFTEIIPILQVSSSTARDITRGDRSRR